MYVNIHIQTDHKKPLEYRQETIFST